MRAEIPTDPMAIIVGIGALLVLAVIANLIVFLKNKIIGLFMKRS